MANLTFERVCATAAAVACLNAGQSFEKIAESAKRHPSTIRKWVRKAGYRKSGGKYRIP